MQTITAPSKPKPKPKCVPFNFVRKVVTLIRESGYNYVSNVLTHEKKKVVIRCHPHACLYKIEGIVFAKAINAGWQIHSITNPTLMGYDNDF